MSKYVRLIQLLLAFILGYIIITKLSNTQQNFEDFALGQETSSHYAMDSIYPIHLNDFKKEKIDSLKMGWEKRGEKEVVLVLGNSQTHGINQYESGQKSYNHLLFEKLDPNYDVITQSFPNANLQELYITYNFWKYTLPVKIIVLPLFMDDTRETGLRTNIFSELASNGFVLNDDFEVNAVLNNELKALELNNFSDDPANSFNALNNTFQDQSERNLNSILNEKLATWNNRDKLRGNIFTNLYYLRNTVFNISAATKRKIIPDRYESNINAFKAFISSAEKEGIRVLVYIPPIRSDVELPYNEMEYIQFKSDVSHIVDSISGEQVINLEGIVPGKYWGLKSATKLFGEKELDFMHFQAEAHQILFEALFKELNTNYL